MSNSKFKAVALHSCIHVTQSLAQRRQRCIHALTIGANFIGVWWGCPLGPNGKLLCKRQEGMWERTRGKTRGKFSGLGLHCNFFSFFFFLFFARGHARTPPPIRKQSKKTFFALRTPCPHLRFTGKAGKKNFAFVPGKLFCTSHPVPALKVHRESREILFLHSFPNNFLRFAPRARA